MLDSEVDAKFFSARVGEKDLTGAVASVSSYKTAQAVFAPVGASAKGLTKLFDTGAVPNPAFVQLQPSAAGDVRKVAAAVVGYGGWRRDSKLGRASRDPYTSLAGQLTPVKKSGIFAQPETARLDVNAISATSRRSKTLRSSPCAITSCARTLASSPTGVLRRPCRY